MLTSAIRSRSASVTSVGSAGSRSSATAAPGDAWAAAADSRQSAAMSAGAKSKRNRPREVEHLVHDPVQTRDLVVDVGDRLAKRRLSGLVLTQRME